MPAEGDWDVRIVPNLYPVLGDDRTQTNLAFGLQQVIDGYGRHEVIIDHPNHGIALHEMSEEHLATLFGVYRQRMADLYASDSRLQVRAGLQEFWPGCREPASRTPTARSSRRRWYRKTCRTRSSTAAPIIGNTTTACSVP